MCLIKFPPLKKKTKTNEKPKNKNQSNIRFLVQPSLRGQLNFHLLLAPPCVETVTKFSSVFAIRIRKVGMRKILGRKSDTSFFKDHC